MKCFFANVFVTCFLAATPFRLPTGSRGRVDGVSSAPAEAVVEIDKKDGALRIVSRKLLSSTREALAVRKGDSKILDVFNAWIEEKRDSVWLKERQDYWFRQRNWAERRRHEPRPRGHGGSTLRLRVGRCGPGERAS